MPTTSQELAANDASQADRQCVRVLHVIDSLLMGGAEHLLLTLATHIDAGRFDMRICSLSPDDAEARISLAMCARAVPVYRASHLRRHDPRHPAWLTRLIRHEAVDLVHTHLPYANTVGLLAARASGRPAISTIHSTEDRHRGQPMLKRRLQGAALRHGAQVVVACSPEVANSAQVRFRIPPRRLVVVPNAIDLAAFGNRDARASRARRKELLDGCEGPLVVAVGSLSSVKGHEHLVDAGARLVDKFPELRVVIVGRDGDNAALVRRRIAELRLRKHVSLTGENGDVPTTLAAADLFVHTSHREGLPLAVLEAMASRVPVVATALGGIPSGVARGSVARLAPPADPRALAEAMAELLRDRDGARELAARARAYVDSNHDGRAWARALEAIYLELIPPKPTSR
jgi:glycosyltransferase involved in cell wall biosynthesis